MKIHNDFVVNEPVGRTWEVLLDVPLIVPCVPGAELLEEHGDGEYIGLASVKIGPIQLQFKGKVKITERDDASHSAKLIANGVDKKGRGNAQAVSIFSLRTVDGETKVDIDTDLSLTGSVAQYGRAEGMIQSIAQEIVGQFSSNLRAMLAGEEIKGGKSISAFAVGASAIKSRFTRSDSDKS